MTSCHFCLLNIDSFCPLPFTPIPTKFLNLSSGFLWQIIVSTLQPGHLLKCRCGHVTPVYSWQAASHCLQAESQKQSRNCPTSFWPHQPVSHYLFFPHNLCSTLTRVLTLTWGSRLSDVGTDHTAYLLPALWKLLFPLQCLFLHIVYASIQSSDCWHPPIWFSWTLSPLLLITRCVIALSVPLSCWQDAKLRKETHTVCACTVVAPGFGTRPWAWRPLLSIDLNSKYINAL